MTVAIDIGASKTLVATKKGGGKIILKSNIKTNHNQAEFLKDLCSALDDITKKSRISRLVIGMAGAVDTKKLVFLAGGVLPWRDFAIGKHLKKYCSNIVLQNDAKLAGLAEATRGAGRTYEQVLYVTISSGIGTAVVDNKHLILSRSEGGQLIVEEGRRRFEDLDSGRAIKRIYGKYGYQIKSHLVWRKIAKTMAPSIYNLITTVGPDVVVLGGGVSIHFRKFIKYLRKYLKDLDAKIYPLPPILKAKFVETAVIEGCFIYKQPPSI